MKITQLIVVAASLLAAGCGTDASRAAKAELAVVEKISGYVGFYDHRGHRVGATKIGTHPHEIVLSPDRRLLYITDNGILWMTEGGEGGNTISIVEVATFKNLGLCSRICG
jgi:hypothetical protein